MQSTNRRAPHTACQHRDYETRLDQRLSKISHLFPKRYNDVAINETIKQACKNPYKSNITSLAYEKFTEEKLDLEQDVNFAKDFYETTETQLKTDVDIISLTQKQLESSNAYVLCEVEKNAYKDRKAHTRQIMSKVMGNAKKHFNQVLTEKEAEKSLDKQQTEKYMKKLIAKLEEVANHILMGAGESASDREKKMLLTKDYLNPHYLAEIKVRNPKVALQILEEIRVLLQKQKLKYEDQREKAEGNKSVTMSFTTEASLTSQTNDSQSKLSETSIMNDSAINDEEAIINRFCNLKELQKKWSKNSIQEVQETIRRVLATKILASAERKLIAHKRKQNEINQKLRRENPKLAMKMDAEKQVKAKSTKSIPKFVAANKPSRGVSRSKVSLQATQAASTLSVIKSSKQTGNQQQAKKQIWMKTGQYDPQGEVFEKTINYAGLFEDKLGDVKTSFKWMQGKASCCKVSN